MPNRGAQLDRNTKVLIAIIAGSNVFNAAKPYTAENINQRIEERRTAAGFETLEKFLEMMKSFQLRLD
jgi:ribosomal protein S11